MNHILSPKNDYVFKLLFTKDTEILTDLINSVLELPEEKKIRNAEVKNPGILPGEIMKKFIVLDIRAVDSSGKEYDIEMQVRRFASYPERALYYLCRLLTDQLKSGQEYSELNPVIGIHFLDYEQFPENPDFAYRFELRDVRYPELFLTDRLTLHIFELPGIGKKFSEKRNILFREWFRFFNHAHEEKEESMRQHYSNPVIHKAFDVLKTLSADEIIRREALLREQSLINESIMMTGERKKGKEEGRKGQVRKYARKMLARGMDINEIAELTSLGIEDIEKLKGKQQN